MLSGSVVRIWAVLASLLDRYETRVANSERGMRVVRVEFGDDERNQRGPEESIGKVDQDDDVEGQVRGNT